MSHTIGIKFQQTGEPGEVRYVPSVGEPDWGVGSKEGPCHAPPRACGSPKGEVGDALRG